MSHPILIACEGPTDLESAGILTDRILEEIDWIRDNGVENCRSWQGLEPNSRYLEWKDLCKLPAKRSPVFSSFDGHLPKHGDGFAVRKLLLHLALERADEKSFEAILLVRDVGREPEREAAIRAVRDSLATHLRFPVVLGFPKSELECWHICGFEPNNERERELLHQVCDRNNLGFDPRFRTAELNSSDDADWKSPKKILKWLTADDWGRRLECLRQLPVAELLGRAGENGLPEFVSELHRGLLPVFDPSVAARFNR